MHPLTNGWFDEAYAICTMLIIFGYDNFLRHKLKGLHGMVLMRHGEIYDAMDVVIA